MSRMQSVQREAKRRNIPLVGTPHKDHFSGENRYRYFGLWLEMAKLKKKQKPTINSTILTQSSISPTMVIKNAVP